MRSKVYENKNYSKFDNFLILKFLKPHQKVLDVGCSEGNLGVLIKKKYRSKVYGIEISDRAYRVAKNRLDNVMKIDIEENFELVEKDFDVIIFADILEHLREPVKCLLKFKEYIKRDGYFILSIPNVANWIIRIKLLFGNFDYEEAGILDETHLRFFTFKSIKKMLNETGLKIEKVDATYNINLPILSRFKWVRDFIQFITRLYKNLLARQFIIVARIND